MGAEEGEEINAENTSCLRIDARRKRQAVSHRGQEAIRLPLSLADRDVANRFAAGDANWFATGAAVMASVEAYARRGVCRARDIENTSKTNVGLTPRRSPKTNVELTLDVRMGIARRSRLRGSVCH